VGARRFLCRHCGGPGPNGEGGKAITASVSADALRIVSAAVLSAVSDVLSREALRLPPGGSVLV
jgi:hypothetical protein